jgi:protein-disulfide isomerase
MSKRNKFFLGLGLFGILAFAAVYFYAQSAGQPLPATQALAPADASSSVTIDVERALADRILGNPDAPIRIAEHSSLTCPHCSHFHQETFDKIKAQWIDTGKAYLIFSDFPLNAPALHASMAARCLPEEKFFDFIQVLYKTQEDWAFKEDYMDILETVAGEHGMDAATFRSCVASPQLREGLLQRMNTVQTMWKINSTPSFVINNKTVVTGALSSDDFSKKIEESQTGAPKDPGTE